MISPLSLSRIFLIVVFFYRLIDFEARSEQDVSQDNVPSFRIAGYVPDYRFDGTINWNKTAELVDDLYLFSLFPQTQLGTNMFQLCCLHPEHYHTARQAVLASYAASSPTMSSSRNTTLWVTVGGAERSHKFTKAPGSMIGALRDLVAQEGLDGVDFDCESFQSHDDDVEYEELLRSAAILLHTSGILMSVALHAGQKMPQDIYNAVDRINLMTYEMPKSTYHADFEGTKLAVQALIQSGCPSHKIFMGIPMYGHHKNNRAKKMSYADIVNTVLESTTEDDGFEMANYMMDSPRDVAQKVKYALAEKLGGVFFWELGQDKQTEEAPGGILLETARRVVEKSKTNSGDPELQNASAASDGISSELNDEL